MLGTCSSLTNDNGHYAAFNVSAQTAGQRGGAIAVTLEGKGLLGRTEKATAAAIY